MPDLPTIPGFGRPLTYVPTMEDEDYVGDLFPSALSVDDLEDNRVCQRLLTLRELAMLRFMNSVTDKPDWHLKANDDEIAEKWKDEACSSDPQFSQRMADWCIAELRHHATLYTTPPANQRQIFVYNGDVVKSDTAVPSELKQALQEAVKKFEKAIPENAKDWHPGSDGKVWDLVHPSLFPLIYGRTRVLPAGETTDLEDCIKRCGQGQVAPITPSDEVVVSTWGEMNIPFSLRFQWLPCEVDISGDTARIASYINNLHPTREKPLYRLLEKLIDASIPLWNATLAPMADKDFTHSRRIVFDEVIYDPDPASWSDSELPQQNVGEDEFAFYDRKDEWIREIRKLVFPEPNEEFTPLPRPAPFDLKEKYGHRGLQVIVKLANIQLTPEKPEYEGGSWHVEGQMNEHIVATSLYYYSSSNITTSTLSFRHQANRDDAETGLYYDTAQNPEWLEEAFGCQNEGPAVQDVGSVETREGRLLTFPNVLQHRVSPFKLADPSRPGHRKIVALFLVDPNIRIASTANVPCQQRDWWWEVAMSGKNRLTQGTTAAHAGRVVSAVYQVPVELQDDILKNVDFPFGMEEAKEARLELMDERREFVVRHGDAYENINTFALCEH